MILTGYAPAISPGVICRSGIHQDGFDLVKILPGDAFQQAADMLSLVKSADYNGNRHSDIPINSKFRV